MAPRKNKAKAPVSPARDIRPYLVALDGSAYGSGGRAFVDAVIDPFGKALCQVCVAGILPDEWTSAPALPHQPKVVIDGVPQAPFVWWFQKPLDAKTRALFYAYLAAPACTPGAHAWLEAQTLALALKRRDGAERELYQVRGRKKGWSIGQLSSDVPRPTCLACGSVLGELDGITLPVPGSPVSFCVPCWNDVARDFVEVVKRKVKENPRG